MTGNIRGGTLPELLVKKTRLRWAVVTFIIALLLLIMLFWAALAEETPVTQLDWIFWRVGLQAPAILVYILALYPLLNNVGNRAFESILPSLDMDKN